MLTLSFEDNEWPFEYTDHDREIVRAFVEDGEGRFYFCRADRDDDFGVSHLIETSGGGVEPGENFTEAIRRELREELGAEVEVLAEIALVSDYYNLIHRHNLNHYYLCRAVRFGDRHLTEDEADRFHLSTLHLGYEEALREYERSSDSPLGRLIARREVPVLHEAMRILREMNSPDAKKHALFLRQKELLDTFLANGAIYQAQYDKSLGDLRVKMGETDL